MMIRSGWHYDDDDPPASRPLYIAVLPIAAWVVVLVTLFLALSRWWPSH